MSMSVSEATAYIKLHCGFRASGDANILIELNRAKEALEDDEQLEEPWFLMKEDTSLATIADTRTVALPSDFVKEAHDAGESGALFRYDSTDSDDPYKELVRQDLAWCRANKTGEGKPTHYALFGANIYLFPLPDDAYPLRLFYKYRVSNYVTGEAARDWLEHAPLLLVGRAGFAYAQAIRDTEAMQFFTAVEQDARRRFSQYAIERDLSYRSLVMGGED